MYEFRLTFHRKLFIRFKLTIFQHWFRKWLGTDHATSHYLNQWCIYWRIYALLGFNELSVFNYKITASCWRRPFWHFVLVHELSHVQCEAIIKTSHDLWTHRWGQGVWCILRKYILPSDDILMYNNNMSMYTYKHYLLFSILHFRYSLVIFGLHSISDLLALHTTK